jgi:carbamoyltransferase
LVLTLGVNFGHDSSAALLEDGHLIAAVEEERFVDFKHYRGPPVKSLEYLFSVRNPDEIDMVGINGLLTYAFKGEIRAYPAFHESSQPIPSSMKLARRWGNNDLVYALLHLAARSMGKKLSDTDTMERSLARWKGRIVLVEHHHSHALSAFHFKPWKGETLVLTLDLSGDGLCSSVNIADETRFDRIGSTWRGDSLGLLYTRVTKLLGLNAEEDEYKVMGLAPYGSGGETQNLLSGLIKLDSGSLSFSSGPLMSSGGKDIHTEFLKRLLAGKRFDNIAAGAQNILEKLALEWVSNCVSSTRLTKVAVAGGVFLNVKMNKAIRESGVVDELFVFPVSGDAGGAIGAALEAYSVYCRREGKKLDYVPLTDLYKGPEYTEGEVKDALRDAGLLQVAKRVDDIEEEVAELLAGGKSIGRFSGRMEFGPRALGNRSILARADDHHMIKLLNEKVKQRTWWMPFAPSMLKRRMEDYLMKPTDSPYMVMSFDTTERRGDLEAAIHPYDFTVRPQTLETDWNPSYEQVLRGYEAKTGYGGFLNTSFNLHGHTLVMSPAQAVWTFKNSGLDVLAIQNYLIYK